MNVFNKKTVNRFIVKMYLKSLTRKQREVRMIFIGKRLAVKQYRFLHFNRHPFETTDKE